MLPAGGARRVGYGALWAGLAFGLWLSLKAVYFVVASTLLSTAAGHFATAPQSIQENQSNLKAFA